MPPDDVPPRTGDAPRAGTDLVPSWLQRGTALSWRALVIIAAIVVVGYVLIKLRLVVLPVIGATFLSTFLVPPAHWLKRRGWRPLGAAWTVFGGFLAVMVALGFLVAPGLIDEFSNLGPVVRDGLDDVEEWLVDGPLNLEPAEVEDLRDEAGDRITDAAESQSGQIAQGAVLVGEVLAGLILALVITFFFIKDGERFQRFGLRNLPERHHRVVCALSEKGWSTLTRYLRGTAIIGLVEGSIIGIAVAVVAGSLGAPVAILTFFAAFFPLVGAVAAGIVATLVALVVGGVTEAVIIAVICLVVQQVDGDLLAPIVLGWAVALHPLVILLVLTGGGTVFGLVGAFLAVPVSAVAVQVTNE